MRRFNMERKFGRSPDKMRSKGYDIMSRAADCSLTTEI
jgi:hypothetical protein